VPSPNAQSVRDHPLYTLLGVLASIVAIVFSYRSLAPDQVDRPLAEQYLRHYYSSVSKDPSKCCYDDLDSAFLALNPKVSRASYVHFFGQFSHIDVSHVRPQDNGYFSARVSYFRDGDPEPNVETDRFQLKCDETTKWPTQTCGVDDISIHDVTNRFR